MGNRKMNENELIPLDDSGMRLAGDDPEGVIERIGSHFSIATLLAAFRNYEKSTRDKTRDFAYQQDCDLFRCNQRVQSVSDRDRNPFIIQQFCECRGPRRYHAFGRCPVVDTGSPFTKTPLEIALTVL